MIQSTANTPTLTPGNQSQKGWLMIALCVSVAINLLVVGIAIGARMNGGPPHAAMLNNSAFSVGHAIRQFNDQRSAQLWPIARPHFKRLRPELRKLRDAQKDWENSFVSEPIDLIELDRTNATLHERINTIQQMNFGAIRALASELSPQERMQMLRALRVPRPPRPRTPPRLPANP